jgi:hypothetical protein
MIDRMMIFVRNYSKPDKKQCNTTPQNAHTYMHTQAPSRTHTHTHVLTHTRAHTHTHTRTHTRNIRTHTHQFLAHGNEKERKGREEERETNTHTGRRQTDQNRQQILARPRAASFRHAALRVGGAAKMQSQGPTTRLLLPIVYIRTSGHQ